MAQSQVLKRQLLLMAKYNKWAHSQIGNFCKNNFKNNPEFYNIDTGIPFKSIRNTLWYGIIH